MISYTGKDCPWGCKNRGLEKDAAGSESLCSMTDLVIICFFFIVSETLAGKRPHEINEVLQECYVQTLMITNYKIWSLAETLNFTFVPIQHRINFVQIVAIFWNAYLAVMDG